MGDLFISGSVSGKLCRPKLDVACGSSAAAIAVGAAMPETAMHEHSDSMPGQTEVRLSRGDRGGEGENEVPLRADDAG
jgi:hypothetical protein